MIGHFITWIKDNYLKYFVFIKMSNYSLMFVSMNKDIISRYNQTNHFGELLGMKYEIHETGEISYHVEVKKDHLATTTAAHGGFLAAVMDAVVGVASPIYNHPPSLQSSLNLTAEAGGATRDLLAKRMRCDYLESKVEA